MNELRRQYTDAEKLKIISRFISSGETMEQFQVKNGMGHCTLSRWMTKFGLSNTSQKNLDMMKKAMSQEPDKNLKELALEAEVAQLKKELENEKLMSLAYKTMIEVAEEQFGIDIRKKAGAKQ